MNASGITKKRANWQEIEAFLNKHFPSCSEKKQSQTQLLHPMREGMFFAGVKVDIETLPNLKEKFSEMTPVLKDLEIDRQDMGEHMQTFAEEHDIMTMPRRALIGSYEGERTLLGTPLLKFHLEEGLVVTHVHQAVQRVFPPLA